jgi:phage portal protein BeeE
VRLWDLLLGRKTERATLTDPISWNWPGGSFPAPGLMLPMPGKSEEIDYTFSSYVHQAYKSNGPVFAVVLSRMLLFSEARFVYQEFSKGRPTRLWSDPSLSLLERPWPNGTTGELLTRAEQDVSFAGNFYVVRERNRLRRLRPDWVELILSAPPDEAVQADIVGISYSPGGIGTGTRKFYLPGEYAHWAPIPDPEAQYLGMSWITPVLDEIISDKAATEHKGRFFTNGATPSYVASFSDAVTEEQFNEFVEQFKDQLEGPANAYKTLFLAGGADVKVVGANLQQLDFKNTQGAGETRICAAGGVPPIIVGLSEGLASATYSNYGMARRKFGDHWARPQWRSFCASIEHLVRTPASSRLWYDDRDIAFLREDEKDLAEIRQHQVAMINDLVTNGWDPDSAVQAVMNDDLPSLVGTHSGKFSVQLQTEEQMAESAKPSTDESAGSTGTE